MVSTLCFLDEPHIALKEIRSVLKTRGSAVICDVVKDSPWEKSYEEKGREGHRFYSHAKLYTVLEMQLMLEEAGFKVTGMTGTLSFNPVEKNRLEEPSSNIEGKSFVCLRV